MRQKVINLGKIITSPTSLFIIGGLMGLLFFGLFYGFEPINPTNTSWIWHNATHDTAQHFIGWQFFRADATGATINGLAYPYGLPVTFMDSIPLLALPSRMMSGILPGSFQYFGLWSAMCYVLMGGFGAIIGRKIWFKANSEFDGNFKEPLVTGLFSLSVAMIFIASPILMARTLYHPALSAQWLVLWAIILIWDSHKISTRNRLVVTWSIVLVMAILIHPYFMPMLTAMMLVSMVRSTRYHPSKSTGGIIVRFIASSLVPIGLAIVVFYLIGGFGLGSGAEVYDLQDKGFNLLSFANPAGYSVIPGFSNRSSSPETMMWFGGGIWLALCLSAVLWIGHYKLSMKRIVKHWREDGIVHLVILLLAVGLLVFSMGNRIDMGPITIAQYQVPDRLYQVWSAFRAAAREAWPFYYGLIILILLWLTRSLMYRLKCLHGDHRKLAKPMSIIVMTMVIITVLQFSDIWFSERATIKRSDFRGTTNASSEYDPVNLTGISDKQKHLIALDESFRGDQLGTYQIARSALINGMTINTGFFARVPQGAKIDQISWRQKVINCQLSADDLTNNLFFTKSRDVANSSEPCYKIAERSGFYFIHGN